MKTVSQNRRAMYDYAISERLEAGIMLSGQEVKSCREGHINLAGAYVTFEQGKPILRHVHIARYRFSNPAEEYNPLRDRQLLLKKNESTRLLTISSTAGMTIVPLEVKSGRFIKVILGIGRGRKRYDKRQKLKEAHIQRRLRRGEDD